ncbi:chaperone SicP [Chromobacterium piscinae]|uniref:Chaperone SicP n=1 Tax=Chromobacterium piscinae TaxID=686831 RepID=A0ABV0HAJ3_9NEIS
MDKHQEQLGLLGQRLGLPLQFDDNRQCLLMLDEHLLVSIRANRETWTLRGFLVEVSPNHSGHIWSTWMAMNLELAQQHAGRLAYEPESHALLYLDELPTFSHPNDIFEQLESFITRLEKLQEDAIKQLEYATHSPEPQVASAHHHHFSKQVWQ